MRRTRRSDSVALVYGCVTLAEQHPEPWLEAVRLVDWGQDEQKGRPLSPVPQKDSIVSRPGTTPQIKIGPFVFESSPRWVGAEVGDVTVADSKRVLLLSGKSVMDAEEQALA